MNNDKIFDEIRALLAEQKQSLLQTLQHVNERAHITNVVEEYVFGDDAVEQYLKNNQINEENVNLEKLRDLQHVMIQDIVDEILDV